WHRLFDWNDYRSQRLAAGHFSGARQDRLIKKKPATRAGFSRSMMCSLHHFFAAVVVRALNVGDLAALRILLPDVHHVVELREVTLLVVGDVSEHGLELHA